MYDPHRLRRNDRRYFTRKGQVIQAKNISPPFAIERSKVEAYRNYILKNNLLPAPVAPETEIDIQNLTIVYDAGAITQQFTDFTYTADRAQIPTIPGDNFLCICIEIFQNYYNVNFNITSEGSATFPENSWYLTWQIPQTNNLKVYFQSGGDNVFNVELIQNQSGLYTTDVELFRTKFFMSLPLPPAPAE